VRIGNVGRAKSITAPSSGQTVAGGAGRDKERNHLHPDRLALKNRGDF
jgi:hypothetical protein